MFPEAVRAAFGVLRIGIGILTKTPASSSAVTLKDYRRRLGDVSAWGGKPASILPWPGDMLGQRAPKRRQTGIDYAEKRP